MNVARKWGLCGVKSFAAKYECSCSFMLFTTTIFKTISVKEMEPNFVRMKVPELKNNLQVWGISVTNKRSEELLDFNFSWISVEARELAIEIWDEQGDQMGISAKLVTKSENIPDPYSLKSDWTLHTSSGLTSCLFSGGKHLLVLRCLCGVSFTL